VLYFLSNLPQPAFGSGRFRGFKMKVIKNSMGDIVPFIPVKESNMLTSYWMTYGEYSELEEVFCQRDTEGRLNKAKKYLSEFITEHAVVFVCKLSSDDVVRGKKYKKGTKFRVDSNTRAMNWENGGSNNIPKDVLVIEFSFESFERIRKCYNTFDSISATEANQEKFYGIITGMFNYEPSSKKFRKGQIITALNMASNCFYPETYTSPVISPEVIPGQTFNFIEEIKCLDSLITGDSNWNQTWICAALMALKKYGTKNERLIEGLQRLDKKKSNTMPDVYDGITTIIEEWKENNVFPEKGTRFSQFQELVSWCLYYIDKWMDDKTVKRIGNEWKKTAKKYKDDKVSNLNKLFNIDTTSCVS
jgi:hypothetical protein